MLAPRRFVHPSEGLLVHLVRQVNAKLAKRIAKRGRVETAVIGLGRQGTRHAGLMKEYGTHVAAAVAPGQGGTRVHETIPVYETAADMLREHPDIALASVWKHYSSAADATIEAIDAGIPIIALISEGMPVKDVQRTLVAARRKGTLLLGPNTPGVIFPPERVKAGMLPDVFHPAEPRPERFAADGVTICSRSGAILYHLSDALASVGIAQNAVIGVGGDSVIGSPFPVIVPMVSSFERTDLVVVAGEIGGCQEELLAGDIASHPERYPKPIVALISGRCAPAGKTMGHAGAIVAPGTDYGTFESKRRALTDAGVTVVNGQHELIDAVKRHLGGRTYFLPERYYERMKAVWEAPPPKPSWTTAITRIAPNEIVVRGRPLAKLIGRRSIVETTALLVTGTFPKKAERERLDRLARRAAMRPVPRIPANARPGKSAVAQAGPGTREDLSKRVAAMMLCDRTLSGFEGSEVEKAVFALGRAAAYLASIFKVKLARTRDFSMLACRAVAGKARLRREEVAMLEGAIVACVDHGVTPPSAQATVLSASVRAAFEVAVASGVAAITDVHGGAGAKAAEFFRECAGRTGERVLEQAIAERASRGERRRSPARASRSRRTSAAPSRPCAG
jgi:succinyl-CoA synthetase alpha subunit